MYLAKDINIGRNFVCEKKYIGIKESHQDLIEMAQMKYMIAVDIIGLFKELLGFSLVYYIVKQCRFHWIKEWKKYQSQRAKTTLMQSVL